MFNKIKAFFLPTVDSLLGQFHDLVDALEAHADHHTNKAMAAQAQADAHNEEANKALAISAKIDALVS